MSIKALDVWFDKKANDAFRKKMGEIGRFRRPYPGIPFPIWQIMGRALWETRFDSVWLYSIIFMN